MKQESVLEDIKKFEIVLVCGIYKTGTSMLTELVENSGFYNPATLTSPFEEGVGRKGDKYLHRECSILSQINVKILSDLIHQKSYGGSLVAHYLDDWKRTAERIVLKDPKFIYTLDVWIDNLSELGHKFCILCTERAKNEVFESWTKSPYTSYLLKKNKDSLNEMTAKYGRCLKSMETSGIHFKKITFDEIRHLKSDRNLESDRG